MAATDKILYPLKFYPILKEKVWGGNKLSARFNKKSIKDNIGQLSILYFIFILIYNFRRNISSINSLVLIKTTNLSILARIKY